MTTCRFPPMSADRRRKKTGGAQTTPHCRRSDRSSGFTLIDLLIVLAVVGILSAIGAMSVRSNNSRLFANDARQLVQQARYESIKADVPVSVIWSAADAELVSFLDEGGNCSLPAAESTDKVGTARTADYPALDVRSSFPGATWYPNGIPRACDGSVLNESRALQIDDGRNVRSLSLTVTGEVVIR